MKRKLYIWKSQLGMWHVGKERRAWTLGVFHTWEGAMAHVTRRLTWRAVA